jgi:hypothetical protein
MKKQETMKAYSFLCILLLCTTGLLLAGCAQYDNVSAEKGLFSKFDATQLLLKKLNPQKVDSVLVRVVSEPLKAGDAISEEFSDDDPRVSTAPEWFFFIDRQPGSFFSHPVQFAYVNRITEAVVIEDRTDIPLLNGEPVWATPEAYQNSEDIVFSNLLTGKGKDDLIFKETFEIPQEQQTPPEEFITDPPVEEHRECCPEPRPRFALILYNFDKGPLRRDISDNVTGMASALQTNGYTVPNFPSSTGSGGNQSGIYLGDKRGHGLQQLRDFVAEHDDEEDCCEEIIIYYTGHGGKKRINGRDRYCFGLRFRYRGEDGNRSGKKKLFAEDFAQILSGLKSCHIHIIIDACHSGGFIDPLFTLPGVETVRVACDENEKAWSGRYDAANGGRTPDPYGRADGEKGSEFTSGFVKGLNENAQSRPVGSPPTPARELVDIGFLESMENDISAIAGKTHPTGMTRIDNSDCDCCPEEDAL